jgi:hypothetical protein
MGLGTPRAAVATGTLLSVRHFRVGRAQPPMSSGITLTVLFSAASTPTPLAGRGRRLHPLQPRNLLDQRRFIIIEPTVDTGCSLRQIRSAVPRHFLRQCHARRESEFVVHVRQVRLHCAMRHEQARGDVFIA